MNKTELIREVANVTGMTQKDIKAILEATQTVVYGAMAQQDEVKLFDGLTLIGQHKDATTARSPLTGETVNVPEKVVPKAKWGKFAKNTVNGVE